MTRLPMQTNIFNQNINFTFSNERYFYFAFENLVFFLLLFIVAPFYLVYGKKQMVFIVHTICVRLYLMPKLFVNFISFCKFCENAYINPSPFTIPHFISLFYLPNTHVVKTLNLYTD